MLVGYNAADMCLTINPSVCHNHKSVFYVDGRLICGGKTGLKLLMSK